jgi:adenylate cyclase class 2
MRSLDVILDTSLLERLSDARLKARSTQALLSYTLSMAAPQEIEIKFFVDNPKELEAKLKQLGFHCETPYTHEINTLYDLPGQKLRRKGELLRLRKYGDKWKLTHKAKGKAGKHKSRTESETAVSDGKQMDGVLRALGFAPTFVYEKFRSEWSDGEGHVVLDHTPIAEIAEIEGKSRWIDRTAKALGISHKDYVTKSYSELFFDWKRKTRQKAMNMTFREIGGRAKPRDDGQSASKRTDGRFASRSQ